MSAKKRKPAAAPKPAARPAAPERRYLWPILVLAFVLRVIYLKTSQASPFFEPSLLDARYYHDWATRISFGDLGGGVFYGLPLYPFFLGFVYKLFFGSLIAAKLTQIMLGLVTVYFVHKTGDEIAGPKVAWVAALIAACYGPLIFHEQLLIPEAVGIPLYAASLYFAIRFLKSPTDKQGLRLGLLLGLCMLTKAGVFLFVLAFIGSRLFAGDAPKFKRPAALCLAIFFLTLAPVTAHNAYHGKDFVPLTSHAGFNFYIGNNEEAEGVFKAPKGTGTNVDAQREDSKAVAERAMGRPLKPSEVSRYWSDKAWKFIREHPAQFVSLCARKLALFFDSREISDVEDYQFAKLFDPFLRLPWPTFALLGPLFFLGLTMGWKKMRHRKLVILWIAGYVAGMLAFFVNARYRLPMLPAMIVVAAVGAVTFIEDFIDWRIRRVSASLAVIVVAVAFTHLQLVGTDFARDYVNAGDAWLERKDPARALPLYDKAIEINDAHAKAHLAKALALTMLGREEEARISYEMALERDPENAQVHNNLGLYYEKKGDARSAERHFRKAIELKPNSFQAYNNLGMIYGKRGDWDRAIEAFEEVLKLNPASARAHTNLGLIHYQKGDRDEARRSWERALAIDPQYADAQRALGLMDKASTASKD